jgi:hypothetical protein
MDALTRHLPSKSAKIRALGAAGYARQQIADFLNIRYQHVRNVLVEEERKRAGFSEAPGSPPDAAMRPPAASSGRLKVLVGSDGSVMLPAGILAGAGYRPGDALFVSAFGEGEVRLLSSRAALRRAQELVRRFVPANISLVDDLLRERRREAELENE